MGIVYVLKTEKPVYKIGFTKNPRERFLDIRVSNHSVRMVSIYAGSRNDEKALHKIFTDKNIRGEWFVLSNEDLVLIEEYFRGKEDIFVLKSALLDLINRSKSQKLAGSLSGRSSIRFNELPVVSLSEAEILAAKSGGCCVKTLLYFKRIWEYMPDATNLEICAKSRYSMRTTKRAMSVLKKAKEALENEKLGIF